MYCTILDYMSYSMQIAGSLRGMRPPFFFLKEKRAVHGPKRNVPPLRRESSESVRWNLTVSYRVRYALIKERKCFPTPVGMVLLSWVVNAWPLLLFPLPLSWRIRVARSEAERAGPEGQAIR